MTRYKSGGVGGTEKDGLKGVAGLVCGREFVPPMKVSAAPCRVLGEVTGGGCMPLGCSFLEALGVCGRDRS